MVNCMWQLDWAIGCPNIWSHIILVVSVRMFMKENDTCLSWVSSWLYILGLLSLHNYESQLYMLYRYVCVHLCARVFVYLSPIGSISQDNPNTLGFSLSSFLLQGTLTWYLFRLPRIPFLQIFPWLPPLYNSSLCSSIPPPGRLPWPL